MRQHLTQPSSKEFFSDYLPLIKTLLFVGFIGQIFSGMTESVSIYFMLDDQFSQMLDAAKSFYLSVVGMIIGVLMIEGGLRVLLPYSIRSALHFKDGWLNITKERGQLGWISIFICICLIFFSFKLSFTGSVRGVAEISGEYQEQSTDSLSTTLEIQRKALYQKYSADSLQIAQQFDQSRSDTKKGFEEQVKSIKNQMYLLTKKGRSEGVSYASKKTELYGKKSDIEAKGTSALLALDTDKRKALSELLKTYRSDLKEISGEIKGSIASVENDNETGKSEHKKDTENKGKGLGWFAVAGIAILIGSILVNEIHKKGSGIKQINTPTDYYYRMSWFAEMKQAIGERTETILRGFIQKIYDGTKNPPLPVEPPIIYESALDENGNAEVTLPYKVEYVNGVNKETNERKITVHLESPVDVDLNKFYGNGNDGNSRYGKGKWRDIKSKGSFLRSQSSESQGNDGKRNTVTMDGKTYYVSNCEGCSKEFAHLSPKSKWCSNNCKQEAYLKRKKKKKEQTPTYLEEEYGNIDYSKDGK